MASKLPVWGIDVGQCSLKAIKLQSSGDKVELQGFDLVEHDQILSQAEADSTSIMTQAIETFASRNDISNARIVVSVPGQQTLTRFTKMPPVEPKKIPDMVQYEASQQIPFDMDEVVWDYQIFTEGETAEVEVGIFAIRKELIRNYLSIFTQLGVEPSIVQTGPMASYNTMRYEISLAEGEAAILLDMGALATDLIVVEGSRIWSRPIPIGGNKFTEALVSAFKVPFKKAERLKRNAGASKYARQIFQAMRPVFADLVSEVQRSIGFYTSTHRDANITRVIGMGNAFKLPGLQKFLHQNLQMKVDKLSEFTHLIETGISKKAEFDENSMSLAVAYGLALQGLELSAVNSNLLPVEVRRTLLWGKKRPWFAASAACLAMASGLLWFGSVMAKGSLSEGLGGMAPNLITPTRYPTAEAAMGAINATGVSNPIKRAADVAGAAKKLKQEFNSAKKTNGDEATLNKLAKFPANNVYIPRILDVIHRSFAEASPSELKEVKTGDDYVRLAASLPRDQRKEIWIENMQVRFGDDPGRAFQKDNSVVVKRGKPGWAVQIMGMTTERTPAKWLEDNLIHAMLELGREPDRGLYFDTVKLGKVKERGKTKLSNTGRSTGRGNRAGGDDRGGGGRRGSGRGRRGAGGGRRGGRPPDGPAGGGFSLPGGGSPGGDRGSPRSSGGGSTAGARSKWREKFASRDPLTMEMTDKDFSFVLEVVIRKLDTPKKLIPEVYQEKKEDKEKADGKES